MNFSPGPFREDPERTSCGSRPGGPAAAARTPAAPLAAFSATGATRKPRRFPGKFALTLWEFPGRAPRRWRWWRGLAKTARDAAALGGVSRNPGFPLCSLRKWRPRSWDSARLGPNSPPMGSVSSGESCNFSRFYPVQDGKNCAPVFEAGDD